jgi:hypothetical protein
MFATLKFDQEVTTYYWYVYRLPKAGISLERRIFNATVAARTFHVHAPVNWASLRRAKRR